MTTRYINFIFLIVTSATIFSSCSTLLTNRNIAQVPALQIEKPQGIKLQAYIENEFNLMQTQYKKIFGLYKNNEWWSEAHNIEALVHHDRLFQSERFKKQVNHNYNRLTLRPMFGFNNFIHDDMAWFALTYLQAGELYKEDRYIKRAENLLNKIFKKGWTAECGGGIYWKPGQKYKNATNNGVTALLASQFASYYERQGNTEKKNNYQIMARKILDWFEQSKMLKNNGLIHDGLFMADGQGWYAGDRGEPCTPNDGPVWTYNQGLFAGTYAIMSTLEKSQDRKNQDLKFSKIITHATFHSLTKGGILFEKSCEQSYGPECAIVFKGIFAENLLYVFKALPENDPFKETIKKFTLTQVNALLNLNRKPGELMNNDWTDRSNSSGKTVSSQVSGIEALLLAYEIIGNIDL